MTREEEKDVAVMMWHDIASHIRDGSIRDINDVEDYKLECCDSEKVDWDNNCWLCEYFVCPVCPLYVKYNAECHDRNSVNPYAKLFNNWDSYGEDEREGFADMAECIAKVIEEAE